MYCIADLNRENPSLHLIQDRVHDYDKSHFPASNEAILLMQTFPAPPIPPIADITSGVNEPCLISDHRPESSVSRVFGRWLARNNYHLKGQEG